MDLGCGEVVGRAQTKKRPERRLFIGAMAERTGLEPATPGVTGRYSNQLNYRSAAVQTKNTGVPKGIRTPVLTVKG